MRTLLICPGDRPAVGHLARFSSLVTLPIYGECILDLWLEHLASAGAREVDVIAVDRPEEARMVAQQGERWGLKLEVLPELTELSPEAALAKYRGRSETPPQVIVLDHLPGTSSRSLYSSYSDWHRSIIDWMPNATGKNRLGLKEVAPQVWVGLRSQIAKTAQLTGPCWIGEHVQVGEGVKIGPNAVVENRVVIDASAEIRDSIIGPETFIGQLTVVEDSLAWGNSLINWRTNSCTQVTDAFLMSSLRPPEEGGKPSRSLLRTVSNSLASLWKAPASIVKKARPGRF